MSSGSQNDSKEKPEQPKKIDPVQRTIMKKRLHQKMRDQRNMSSMRQKMGNNPQKNFRKFPDLSTISRMTPSELGTLASMTGISVSQLTELSKLSGLKDLNQLKMLEPISEEEKIVKRAELVEKLSSEGKFEKGTDQELHLVYSFMERVKTDKTLPEDQKDKLRAMIILYNRLHGLGPKTPQLSEWKDYGISPDEILMKSVFKVSNNTSITNREGDGQAPGLGPEPGLGLEQDDELSELSELSSD